MCPCFSPWSASLEGKVLSARCREARVVREVKSEKPLRCPACMAQMSSYVGGVDWKSELDRADERFDEDAKALAEAKKMAGAGGGDG